MAAIAVSRIAAFVFCMAAAVSCSFRRGFAWKEVSAPPGNFETRRIFLLRDGRAAPNEHFRDKASFFLHVFPPLWSFFRLWAPARVDICAGERAIVDAWESGRFVVRVEEGPPRGGLYELEQTTYFHVVDTRTNLPAMTFLGELEASLSAETGLWENYRCSGVREAAIAPDGRSVLVRRFDGSEETVGLPESGDG